MATLGLSKVFILDKYFTELQKFWENEKKVQVDASNSVATSRSQVPAPVASRDEAGPGTMFWSAVTVANQHEKNTQTHQDIRPLKRRNGDLGMSSSIADSRIEDLIHLSGPITEEAILRTLQARFHAKSYCINAGPILLALNPYCDVGNPLTLSSTRDAAVPHQLVRVVQEAVRQQSETGYSQAVILSGVSGSGKTYASMLLLRQLFEVAGGGPETDAFKHLAAAFTVLRSLGCAKTHANSEASRIGHFIEVQVTDGALYRTKIHCYFLDQTRVVRPVASEKNYHIFYQLLAGLTADERSRLHLDGYSVYNLQYLNRGDTQCNEMEDSRRFAAWRACLGILGIPFFDVVRVLAAILLLGNVSFCENNSNLDTDRTELKAAASLLGVCPRRLHQGLVVRTHNVRGQRITSACDAYMSSQGRDALAKALYCRTVATIVRRTNSLKRLCTSGTLSSDSNDSLHNHTEVASQHASTVGTAGSRSSRSMAVLNSAVKHATDGFIGILDMFGFENPKISSLEHLCVNLCAETMQHFFNTHVFKSIIESCRDEGIDCDVQPDYIDNVPCIDLISSLRTGLLSMLDVECASRGSTESYVQKIRSQHKNSPRFFPSPDEQTNTFTVQHFAGKVVYDATDFLGTNRDVIPDDLVFVFHKQNCSFGFASHLFGAELKSLAAAQEVAPRGVRFRISPTSQSDLLNRDEPASTLTQDFHTRLDNLLRTLVHAKPHFVRCVRSNGNERSGMFDRPEVARQIRSLEVLETVSLMSGGLAHRMRYRAFNSRYKMLAPLEKLQRHEEKAIEDSKLILEHFLEHLRLNSEWLSKFANVTTNWALGKRHIFLSECARQQLELVRSSIRSKAAVLIQSTWRGWKMHKQQLLHSQSPPTKSVVANLNYSNGSQQVELARPRPQPVACTPVVSGLAEEKYYPTKTALPQQQQQQQQQQQNCNLFGIDLWTDPWHQQSHYRLSKDSTDSESSSRNKTKIDCPPPLPPSRPYTVNGNAKLSYPQTRYMKSNFPAELNIGDLILRAGERVLVTGASNRRGHLVVQHKNQTVHVPFQYLQLKP